MRVLLSAYACEPGKGSEPAVGWNWAQQISRFHEVWVVTRANNRGPIEQAMAGHPLPNVHWVYYDLPRSISFWKRGQRGVHLYYYLWQIGACRLARKLHARIGFDLVHHVTFAQYEIPSFMGLIGAPFLWGPVGGGESAPLAFWFDFSHRGKLFELRRNLGRWFASIDPVARMAARRSRFALATTEETARSMRRVGAPRLMVHPMIGLTGQELQYFASFPIRRTGPFRVISMGRLLHWKGFHLALRAFARFHSSYPDSEYWIAGQGPEYGLLQTLARQLGIEDRVVFWGQLTLDQVYGRLAQCDVLVHPALHEGFGVVCLEAMSAGRPVICLDLGGPAFQVTEATGIKVSAVSPQQAVTDLAAAMLRLAQDPELRGRMGQAARQHVAEHFNWDKLGEYMSCLYTQLTDEKVDSVMAPWKKELSSLDDVESVELLRKTDS